MNPTPLRLLSGNRFLAIVLPVLAVGSLAACNSTNGSKNKQSSKTSEEKIITLPMIKDSGSVNNLLHQKLPFRYTMKNKNFLEIQSNTARLHIKGDSCWLEYISDVVIHKHQSNGPDQLVPKQVSEPTDRVVLK